MQLEVVCLDIGAFILSLEPVPTGGLRWDGLHHTFTCGDVIAARCATRIWQVRWDAPRPTAASDAGNPQKIQPCSRIHGRHSSDVVAPLYPICLCARTPSFHGKTVGRQKLLPRMLRGHCGDASGSLSSDPSRETTFTFLTTLLVEPSSSLTQSRTRT